jgi:hypothetical protein
MGLLFLDCESEYHIIVTNVKKTCRAAAKTRLALPHV